MEKRSKPVQEMTEDMKRDAITKLYKGGSRPTYGEISAELKAESLAAAIEQQQAFLQEAFKRGKADLNNADEVQGVCMAYLEACKLSATVPTLAGLASALGVSRSRVYKYLSDHPGTESAAIIDRFRSSCASILATGALSRVLDNSTAIFLLKNSGQGFSDKSELEVTAAPYGASSDPYVRDQVQPYLAQHGVNFADMSEDEQKQKYFELRYVNTGDLDRMIVDD